MSKRRELDATMAQIDKELLELQIISAVRNLRENHPDHPFVLAITVILEKLNVETLLDNPYQQELQL